MESHDSYPVFHTRLERTFRRRLTRPDGTHAGWLILNSADRFIEVVTDVTASIDDLDGPDGPDGPDDRDDTTAEPFGQSPETLS